MCWVQRVEKEWLYSTANLLGGFFTKPLTDSLQSDSLIFTKHLQDFEINIFISEYTVYIYICYIKFSSICSLSGKKILLNLQYNKALFQLFVGAKEITSFTEFQSGGDGFRYDLYAFRIAELIIHPKYKFLEKGRKRPDYDIALVRLNYPVYDDESNLGVLKVSTIYSFGPVIFGFVRILIILMNLGFYTLQPIVVNFE